MLDAFELRRWIASWRRAGATDATLVAHLKRFGWPPQLAEHVVTPNAIGQRNSRSGDGLLPSVVPAPNLHDRPTSLPAEGRSVRILAAISNPHVVVFGDVATADECAHLMDMARSRLKPSTVVDLETGGNQLHRARTSEGMFFEPGENDFIRALESRIAGLVNWPIENGEGLQILRYGPQMQYEPHYDYFPPQDPGTASLVARGGQRVASFILYLNTPQSGGGTVFPDLLFEVTPQRGNAVFFSYDRPHPDTRTLHGGAPVLAGEKWIATKWLRERKFVD